MTSTGEVRVTGGAFAVQHHLAAADHFDFRLQLGPTLLSWAAPRGPSLNPAHRRMAIRTPDRPAPAGMPFEGVHGRSGSGRASVTIVWDHGSWTLRTSRGPLRPADAWASLAAGEISVLLDGQRLRGTFTLIRLPDPRETWLLVKNRDAEAIDHGVGRNLRAPSVLSGATLDALAAAARES